MTGLDIFSRLNHETLIEAGIVLMNIFLILIAAWIVLRLIHRGLSILESKELLAVPILLAARKTIRWIAWVATAMLILQQIGVSVSNVWTVISAAVAMIAIGFVAVWSVLSNLLCTVMLIIFHPFRIGDEIEIIDPAMTTGVSGKVRNIDLMFTTLADVTASADTPAIFQIPNNLLFQKIIRRKGGERTFSLDKQLFEPRSLLRTNGNDLQQKDKVRDPSPQ